MLVIAGLFIFWTYVLNRTRFGRHVYAVGGNAEAARRAGINVASINIRCFAICSMMAAIGGIILASRLLSVNKYSGGGSCCCTRSRARHRRHDPVRRPRHGVDRAASARWSSARSPTAWTCSRSVGGKFMVTGGVLLPRCSSTRFARQQRQAAGRVCKRAARALLGVPPGAATPGLMTFAGASSPPRTSPTRCWTATAARSSWPSAREMARARRPGPPSRACPAPTAPTRKLLADPEVDAVYNPLPNALHVEWSIRALEAGKHVLCEKPLSRHPEDVERAFDVAREQGRVLAEAFMWRHHPQVAAPRELIEAGEIGDLRVIRAGFAFAPPTPRTSACTPSSRAAASWTSAATASAAAARSRAPSPSASMPSRWSAAGRRRRPGRHAALPRRRARPPRLRARLPRRRHLDAVGTEGSLFLDDPWHGHDR